MFPRGTLRLSSATRHRSNLGALVPIIQLIAIIEKCPTYIFYVVHPVVMTIPRWKINSQATPVLILPQYNEEKGIVALVYFYLHNITYNRIPAKYGSLSPVPRNKEFL